MCVSAKRVVAAMRWRISLSSQSEVTRSLECRSRISVVHCPRLASPLIGRVGTVSVWDDAVKNLPNVQGADLSRPAMHQEHQGDHDGKSRAGSRQRERPRCHQRFISTGVLWIEASAMYLEVHAASGLCCLIPGRLVRPPKQFVRPRLGVFFGAKDVVEVREHEADELILGTWSLVFPARAAC